MNGGFQICAVSHQLFFSLFFFLNCISSYISFVEKHDRGELVWPRPGGCEGQIHACAMSYVQSVFTSANVFVQYVVENDPQLQIQLVQMLVKYSGLQKAAQWSLKYKVPREELPWGVWETQQNLPPHQWVTTRTSAYPGKQIVVCSGTSIDANLFVAHHFLSHTSPSAAELVDSHLCSHSSRSCLFLDSLWEISAIFHISVLLSGSLCVYLVIISAA